MIEGGKGGGGMGRNGYRRDYRQPDRGGFMERGSGATDNSASKGSYSGQPARAAETLPSAPPQTMVSDLEKRLSGVQQDFTQQLHKISEKENEKFDLIFAILSELQSRQAQLEESVRTLKAQYGGGQMVGASQMVGAGTGPANISPPQQAQTQQAQFNSNSNGHQTFGQMCGQMNGPQNANMNNQQSLQQFTGVMQPDGTQAMFTAVPQVVVVSSPTAAGMQYAMPQMMSPTANMQPMPPQMAMQFIGQGQGQDMGTFVNGQEPGSGAGAQSQVQPNHGHLANASNGAADAAVGQQCQADDSNAQLHSMSE